MIASDDQRAPSQAGLLESGLVMRVERNDESTLSVNGRATLDLATDLLAQLRSALGEGPVTRLETSGVTAIDIAGFQVLYAFASTTGARVTGLSEPVETFCATTHLGFPGSP